jgi:hypothetical protein
MDHSTRGFSRMTASTRRPLHEGYELGSRAHYNRLVGQLVQEEYYPTNVPYASWSQDNLDWVMDLLDFANDDVDQTIRSKLLGPYLLEFSERPSLDLLDLPDRNEF